IKRFFLKEGNPDGLDLKIPNGLYSITDASELFLKAASVKSLKTGKRTTEEGLWSALLLKVMHTILHTDKDLRYRYFSTIQQQIFDRFYKYLQRDESNNLFLYSENTGEKIPLYDFETKAKKTRESII